MEFPAMKYMHLLPNSFSDLEKLRCSLFLASEAGRLWLTHFMLQWKYDAATQTLGFYTDFIEDGMSHFLQAISIQRNTCLQDVAKSLKNNCWLWCGLWYQEENYPAWIYGVDEGNKRIYLFRCTLDGLKQDALDVNEFNELLFCNTEKIEVLSFSTDKPLAPFSPVFIQNQISFFLDSMDFSCLERPRQNVFWGIEALQYCCKLPMFSEQHFLILRDHLLFMNYRLLVWSELFTCDTAYLKQVCCILNDQLEKLPLDYTTESKQTYSTMMRAFYEKLGNFVKEVFV